MDNISEAQAVLKEVDQRLRNKPNIIGTGIGYKNNDPEQGVAIIANAVQKQPKGFGRHSVGPVGRVAASYDGIMTDVLETGSIVPLNGTPPSERQEEWRPAPGGVSIGHPKITAGTLGCLVKKDGQTLILSNNHVLANSNDAKIGDPIYQPGPFDGGEPEDKIAELSAFEKINFEGEESNCELSNAIVRAWNWAGPKVGSQTRLNAYRSQGLENLVDAAIAYANPEDLKPEILDIGEVAAWTEGTLGMEVKKSGRTTALTTDRILQVSVTVQVSYGPNKMAIFKDQLLAGPMSQGGDSGSAVVDENNQLVGLLFAGSDSTTIFNRIEHVFSTLGVTIQT